MNLARTDRSVVNTARWAGALNLLSGVPDGFAVGVVRKLFVPGDATATAAHLVGAEGLLRLGLVADLAGLLLFLASGILLYETFRPASRRGALFFLVFILGGSFIQSIACVHGFAALVILKGIPHPSGLSPAQAGALAFVSLRAYSLTYTLGLFFDACSSMAMGFLLLRATFVLRLFAPLMTIDGLGGLTFTLTSILSPPLASHLFPYIPMVTFAVGEGSLYLWLIIKGVNAARWREQAAATERTPA